MVPDTWQVMPLADICDEKISYGIVQAGPHIEDGIPYIKSSDLNSELKLKDLQRTALEIHNKYIRSTVRPGDIIFSLRGNIGLCRIVPASIPEANLTQGTARISVKPEYSTEFFLQQITGPELNKSIQAKAKGSTFQEISLEALRKVPVLVPPKAEQTRIAQILSTWDKAITTTERLLANSQQQKQALLGPLLSGQKRFAGYPEWVSTPIAKLLTESRLPGSNGEVAKKITVKLYGNGVFAKDEKRIGSESTKYFTRKAGQFIYSKLDFLNGAFGIIPKHLDGYESTLDLPAFNFTAYVEPAWLVQYISREEFYSAQLGLANGGRKARRVNPTDLLRIEIPLPSLPEQQKIAQVLSTADAEISNLQAQLAKLKLEKKALMQQLLTGQRRVKLDDEVEAPIRRVG